MVAKNNAVTRMARVTSFQYFSRNCCKNPRKSNSSPNGAIIATAINSKINPNMVSGSSKPFRSTIYSGAGRIIWMILSNSSDRMMSPMENNTHMSAVKEEMGLSLSRLKSGSFLEVKNQIRGTSMNPWPMIKEMNV